MLINRGLTENFMLSQEFTKSEFLRQHKIENKEVKTDRKRAEKLPQKPPNLLKYSSHKQHKTKKEALIKYNKKTIKSKTHKMPEIRFEDQKITSFSGLIIIQLLIKRLNLKEK